MSQNPYMKPQPKYIWIPTGLGLQEKILETKIDIIVDIKNKSKFGATNERAGVKISIGTYVPRTAFKLKAK